MNEVFKVVKKTANQVVIKVNAEDNLVVATHPYVAKDYDYITVTLHKGWGREYICTVVRTNGETFSFSWGSSTTCIGGSLVLLREAVIQFLLEECGLDWD